MQPEAKKWKHRWKLRNEVIIISWELTFGFGFDNCLIYIYIYTPQKLRWQWKIHHWKMYFPLKKGRFSNVMLVFGFREGTSNSLLPFKIVFWLAPQVTDRKRYTYWVGKCPEHLQREGEGEKIVTHTHTHTHLMNQQMSKDYRVVTGGGPRGGDFLIFPHVP